MWPTVQTRENLFTHIKIPSSSTQPCPCSTWARFSGNNWALKVFRLSLVASGRRTWTKPKLRSCGNANMQLIWFKAWLNAWSTLIKVPMNKNSDDRNSGKTLLPRPQIMQVTLDTRKLFYSDATKMTSQNHNKEKWVKVSPQLMHLTWWIILVQEKSWLSHGRLQMKSSSQGSEG